jgi:hypothetical protein
VVLHQLSVFIFAGAKLGRTSALRLPQARQVKRASISDKRMPRGQIVAFIWMEWPQVQWTHIFVAPESRISRNVIF